MIGGINYNPKLIKDIKKILNYTNALPYKTSLDNYTCAYCSHKDRLKFDDPKDLRLHYKDLHENHRIEKVEEILKPYAKNECLKIDITNLQCTMCNHEIPQWRDILKHLKQSHKIELTEALTKVIPFTLALDNPCCLCDMKFSTYQMLNRHMNSHYSNYLCGDCGDPFLSKERLRRHGVVHKNIKFKCQYCPKEYGSSKARSSHENLVHKRILNFKCDFCDERFTYMRAKKYHCLRAHPETIEPVNCDECDRQFSCRAYYNKHKNLFHRKTRDFLCNICPKAFKVKHLLMKHLRWHRGELKEECLICGQVFPSKQWVKTHYAKQHADVADVNSGTRLSRGVLPRKVHKEPSPVYNYALINEIKTILSFTNATPYKSKAGKYICAYCEVEGPTFHDPEDLRIHCRELHQAHRLKQVDFIMKPAYQNEVLKMDIMDLTCTRCDLLIADWNGMFEHLKKIHDVDLDEAYTKVIPYTLSLELECALCKQKFKTYHILDAHMNAHYNNYLCGQCGETFLAKTRLKKHTETHSSGKFKCDYCDKIFVLNRYRLKHINFVHKQQMRFKCAYCPEQFRNEYGRHCHCLDAHPETIKTMRCQLCNKEFNWRPYYLNHLRLVHNKSSSKRFKCNDCSKTFVTKHQLKNHQAWHRGEHKKECGICGKTFASLQYLKKHHAKHIEMSRGGQVVIEESERIGICGT